jgi:hypothetical protein
MSESLNLDSLYSELINSEMSEVGEYIITTQKQILAKITPSQDNEKSKSKINIYKWKNQGSQKFLEELEPWLLNWLKN